MFLYSNDYVDKIFQHSQNTYLKLWITCDSQSRPIEICIVGQRQTGKNMTVWIQEGKENIILLTVSKLSW